MDLLFYTIFYFSGHAQTNGSIARSVPSHGLNGGVFPHSSGLGLLPGAQKANTPSNGFLSQSCQNGGNTINGSNSTCTSSNGYYGFQPTNSPPGEALNGHTNGAAKPPGEQPEDCEMETDANPLVEAINGKEDKPTQPFLTNFMTTSQNGISNGQTNGAMSTYTNGSLQNGSCKFANGHNGEMNHVNGSPGSQGVVHKMLPRLGEDITLSDGVSKNFIPIAGCKRSREDVYVPEMKRMKTDGKIISILFHYLYLHNCKLKLVSCKFWLLYL